MSTAPPPPRFTHCDFCFTVLPAAWSPWPCDACGLDYRTCVSCRDHDRCLTACPAHDPPYEPPRGALFTYTDSACTLASLFDRGTAAVNPAWLTE